MLCKTTNARKSDGSAVTRGRRGRHAARMLFNRRSVCSAPAPACIQLIGRAGSTQPGPEAAAPERSHQGSYRQSGADAELSYNSDAAPDVRCSGWGIESSAGHGAADA